MRCTCGSATVVRDTRLMMPQVVRRRRECPACGARFTTRERVETTTHNQRSAIINSSELATLSRLFNKVINIAEGAKE